MESVNNRFKQLRKACEKSQEEWGNLIGITRAGVCDIEAGRINVTDKHIKLLAIEPINGKYINVDWLLNGTGEMFVPMNRDEQISKFAGELLKEDDSFKKRLIEALSKLDENEWELLEKIAKKLAKKD